MPDTIARETAAHPFERAGLGTAPFRCVAVVKKQYQACPGAPIQPAGTCDYCGNGILYVYMIVGANGERFGVGCDCALRTVPRADRKRDPLARQVSEEKRKLDAAARNEKKAAQFARDTARVAAARAALEADAALLAGERHPRHGNGPFFQKLTLRDWAEWNFKNAGMTGRLEAARVVERHVAEGR